MSACFNFRVPDSKEQGFQGQDHFRGKAAAVAWSTARKNVVQFERGVQLHRFILAELAVAKLWRKDFAVIG